ncbi:MAG: LysM peptidoglycan-binding domain-containing protein [Flavobacteriales bacterium]
MRILLLICCLSCSLVLLSQSPSTANTPKYHVVEAGQTLYAIAKIYGVSVDELTRENPGSETALSIGQRLTIPGKQTKIESTIAYIVKPGDTYYGISRTHGITIDELKALNNGMPAGLIAGDTIVVPGINNGVQEIREVAIPDSVNQLDAIVDIGVMLPFYSSVKDSLASRDYRLREAAIHIYRGVLSAADSLEKLGFRANIHVWDVTENNSKIHRLLSGKEMEGIDLIIGPLFKEAIAEVQKWCLENNAHMVVPVQQPNRVLLNAPALSKAVAGAVTQWMSIARYAFEKFGKDNVVLIDSKILDDRKLVESFKEEWLRLVNDSLKNVIVCDDLSNLNISSMLPHGKCLVAVPTNDKKVISAVFRSLGGRSDIDVIGLESWDDLESINTGLRNKYHVSFPQQTFLNTNSKLALNWRDNYRRKFYCEPTDFSLIGYDVLLYSGIGLMKHGRNFPANWQDVQARTVGTTFDFIQSGADAGYENAAIQIIRTNNFQVSRAN